MGLNNVEKIERKIKFHRMMANKMLAKYGGITGDLKCIEHTKIADNLERKLNQQYE